MQVLYHIKATAKQLSTQPLRHLLIAYNSVDAAAVAYSKHHMGGAR